MIDDQFTPEDQQATQQLSAAPKPKLEATAREAIRQQVLNEFRLTINANPQRIPQRRMTRPILQVTAIAAAITVIAIGLVLAQSSNNRQGVSQNSTTLTAAEDHQTGVMPSVTSALTMVAAVPTQIQLSPSLTEPEATLPSVSSQPPSAIFTAPLPRETLTSMQPEPTQPASAIFAPTTSAPTLQPSATFTPTQPLTTPTATPVEGANTIVIIEGTITNIVGSTLTINGFDIQVEPDNPILSIIDIGDTVHIEGSFTANDVIIANVVSNIPETTSPSRTPVTVGLDGPVESINGTEVVVNSVIVRLDPNDPLVGKLHVGDFVRVQGNFEGSGATTVLVVVNITVINNIVVNGTPTCTYSVDGMGMGHWHCDGMGMGMGNPAMGMGDDGMGMGDDGMGMGG